MRGERREEPHHVGVELCPRPLSGHADSGVGAAGTLDYLHDVSQVHETRRDRDVVSLQPFRGAATVPALEALFDRVVHDRVETQPGHELVRCTPVVLEQRLGSPLPLAHEGGNQSELLVPREPTAQVTQHEKRTRGRGVKVDQTELALQDRIVAEPFRLFVGVNVAANPRDE